MGISQRSFFHGAVLAEITADTHFTSINQVPNIKSPNAYQLNHNIGIFVKYSNTDSDSWRFSFSPEHQNHVRKLCDIYGPERTFVIFVCGNVGFCIIPYGVFAACLDLNH